jgi:phosphoribosyl 1,2-cyclic phosphate phosphodiesterase
MKAEIIVLGSGTSMGVPTLGCRCAVCTSSDPRNRRTRPSIAIAWKSEGLEHLVVIDTGPDFREQADHILGLDDLRPLSFEHKPGLLPLYADARTAEVLGRIFEYTFSPHATYPNRARVQLHNLEGLQAAEVFGAKFQRIPLLHGDLEVAGFRFGSAAYLTDMSSIPDSSLPLLEGLDVMILDALRPQPHPSHAAIPESLEWVERVRPRAAWFTHMSHEVDHEETEKGFPANVRLAYDGLRIPFEL